MLSTSLFNFPFQRSDYRSLIVVSILVFIIALFYLIKKYSLSRYVIDRIDISENGIFLQNEDEYLNIYTFSKIVLWHNFRIDFTDYEKRGFRPNNGLATIELTLDSGEIIHLFFINNSRYLANNLKNTLTAWYKKGVLIEETFSNSHEKTICLEFISLKKAAELRNIEMELGLKKRITN